MMTPRIDCSQSPLEVRLQPWEIVKMDLEDPSRVEEWKKLAERFALVVKPHQRLADVYRCGGGVEGFAMDPEGKMSLCVLSHQEKYDWRDGSVAEGWDRFIKAVRAKPATRVTKCTACEIRDMCGMCPANAELENGDPEAPVDFLCHVAHLRAHSMGIPVPPHGDCEYCEGGSRHAELVSSAESLEQGRTENWMGTASRAKVFPIAAVSGGGCGSCGAPGGGCSSQGA